MACPDGFSAVLQAASYMGEALERVVGHNFTGDETEPPANTGSAGWKGDIHDRKRDGCVLLSPAAVCWHGTSH